ncbi:ribonuclease III domain-containing protein [Auriculariales sp. MPI-PUGE-AT-0066]|nr:ribonuclease III domain-containing protein [Auriculariales sp. MPI-PUGE-AT-0066]
MLTVSQNRFSVLADMHVDAPVAKSEPVVDDIPEPPPRNAAGCEPSTFATTPPATSQIAPAVASSSTVVAPVEMTGDRVRYPILPALGSRLSNMVYSHKSVYGSSPRCRGHDYLYEPRDYERLVFAGSGALQAIIGLHLLNKHPLKNVAFLTQVRSRLLSKEMLAHWAVQYRMPAQLQAHEAYLPSLRTNINIQASLFEAFIGGLIDCSGFDAASAFVGQLVNAQLAVQAEGDLFALGSDKVKVTRDSEGSAPGGPNSVLNSVAAASSVQSPPGEQKNRLSILNERASQLGKMLSWKESPQGPEHSKSWKMSVFVDGVVKGEGFGDRKQIAKIAAADCAWDSLGWR